MLLEIIVKKRKQIQMKYNKGLKIKNTEPWKH